MQPSFFDLEDRYKKLDERDPLTLLKKTVPWEEFRPSLEAIRQKERKNNSGRRPFDVVLMFKALVLQHLYNISDDELEFQIRDRYSFIRFLDLLPEDKVPDSKTLWLFREELTKLDLVRQLFIEFELVLQEKGYTAKKGQIIDASIVAVPIQRNSREENAQIKTGEKPERFAENPAVDRQKDVDARWTEKNGKKHFGYKDHISVDVAHKMIRDYEVTSAEVHDSNVFGEILSENSNQAVWADSAYRSEENEVLLEALDHRSQVHQKAKRGQPLTDRQKQANKKKSKIRGRVEHIFGSMENEQGGMKTRVIGLARVANKIGLMNLTYNMRRLVTLIRMNPSKKCQMDC